jgi:hypothetical protein
MGAWEEYGKGRRGSAACRHLVTRLRTARKGVVSVLCYHASKAIKLEAPDLVRERTSAAGKHQGATAGENLLAVLIRAFEFALDPSLGGLIRFLQYAAPETHRVPLER